MNKDQKQYFDNVRHDILSLLPDSFTNFSSLEIGCGAGATSEWLKSHLGANKVVGVELNKQMAKLAAKRMDLVINSSVESYEFPFLAQEFDLLILADVLEHLIDPWKILKNLCHYLKIGGTVLISIPNIQHWRNIRNLVSGNWDYQDAGMLDRTHLRFFTKKSIVELVEKADLNIDQFKCIAGPETLILDKLTFGIFSGLFSYHYFVLAKRTK